MMLGGELLVTCGHSFVLILRCTDVLPLAFGYSAGYAGSALAVKDWAWQLTHPEGQPLPSETPYANQNLLIESVKESLEAGKKSSGRSPKVLVIGAVSHGN